MDIFDQHIHTNYSFDSKEHIEAYIKKIDTSQIYFVTTEHKEFKAISNQYIEPDFAKLRKDATNINSHLTFLYGVEIGYKKDCHNEINEFLDKTDLDLVLLSVHDNEILDYINLPKLKKEEVKKYYDNCISAVKNIKCNVIAHLDYPFRYGKYRLREMLEKDRIDELLKVIIKKQIAIEFNTTSVFKAGNLQYYKWILERYYNLGGQSIVLSSDAHSRKDHKYMFAESIKILEDIGFKTLSYYIKQKEYLLLISEVKQYYV